VYGHLFQSSVLNRNCLRGATDDRSSFPCNTVNCDILCCAYKPFDLVARPWKVSSRYDFDSLVYVFHHSFVQIDLHILTIIKVISR